MLVENVSPTTLVLFAWWLSCSCCVADIGLPLIQISHDDDLGDDYPEIREEVHLEDFFWTGSGDGPPDYLKKVHTGISKGKDVIVKTETVVATVYVDGNNEIDIPICLDCPPDDGGGTWGAGAVPPLNYSATDRRYWLLTVMSGFYSQKDNPVLEEKLARLYRLAFTRQQTKHLGINGAQQIAGIAVSAGRNRRQHEVGTHAPETTTPQDFDDDAEMLDMTDGETLNNRQPIQPKRKVHSNTEWETSSEENEMYSPSSSTTETNEFTSEADNGLHDDDGENTTQLPHLTIVPWELIQEDAKTEKLQAAASLLESQASLVPYPPQNPLLRNAQVRVIIHNITQITEEELQKGTHSLGDEDVNEKIDERPIANQTELVYSVFVNGRPVLAVTAANDMKLVSESEAANVIGQEVYMKSEPYLREPQATPLAPAIRSGQAGFIDSIQNNTALVVVSSIAILLVLLLLLSLLLMGRSRVREKRRLEEQRTTSRNELLAELQSGRGASTETGLDTGRTTTHSRDVGVQNFSFEHDGSQRIREPHINFPGPPRGREYRRDSVTSSDNTSDSSVYCPINPPGPDVQRILDDKAAKLFDKHRRRHTQQHEYDQAEGREAAVYTTVMTEKKHDKSRRKNKRRYLSENRVGSLETSPRTHHAAQSSGDEVVSGSLDDDALTPTYANFERNEAFNTHVNYHRNKLLHQKSMYADKDDSEQLQVTEAINKEVIRTLQPTERSSDTGSIGSFLSMASVKAFPKSSLPQPLNRVLDPVFVTYYDNVEDQAAKAPTRQVRKQQNSRQDTFDATAIATIESFPTPKAPTHSNFAATQSDNPDPGVIGPIVWERHKKRMSEAAEAVDADDMLMRYDDDERFGNNPGAIRTHYEDLLESAIHMYSNQDDMPMPLPTLDFSNKRKPTKRENRGSSAGVLSFAARLNNSDIRPATAQPLKTSKSNNSTQPPSPASGAWGGSLYGSHSPLSRPMSAGPIQRSETFQVVGPPRSASNRSGVSAEPLIEAIKSELRRFKDDKH
ncbi:uncharacterized protein LOC101459873 isoform X2 [Ceratitis capitata]|uniref:(Mediterranean fruit fly) hypothetical protein n=1 Tax=Ceratitis capitata TaxID=7213 RepID=A0A811U333_CERCA|nr:uncharacterized protein LOC101459873 isoform X2 [Ceratitis capitata]CAD6993319.1 unnamed protein product [Ceratitis capitata]